MMQWDYRDQLQATSQQVNNGGTPEITYYVYDAAGQRVRKVTERSNGTRSKERIYLGGVEIYREYDGDGDACALERETLHIMDDKQRIALVETKTWGSGNAGELDDPVIRYQLGNHLGSASLELDRYGEVISYEEYSPYGSTAYQAGRSSVEISLKRYRYTGMERDEETGLNYHGARYYSVWLGRWVSCDPIGLPGGISIFVYGHNNPNSNIDINGWQPSKPKGQITPEAGKHPEAVLAESVFNRAWEAALERRYKGGSPARNQEIFLERLARATDKKAFGAREYTNTQKVFKNVVKNDPVLSQYDLTNVELHHMEAKKQNPVPTPEQAVNPNNLLITKGKARVEGTSHNIATVGPGEVRRQRAELARRQRTVPSHNQRGTGTGSLSAIGGGKPPAGNLFIMLAPVEPLEELTRVLAGDLEAKQRLADEGIAIMTSAQRQELHQETAEDMQEDFFYAETGSESTDAVAERRRRLKSEIEETRQQFPGMPVCSPPTYVPSFFDRTIRFFQSIGTLAR